MRYNTIFALTWLISKDLYKIKSNISLIAKCLIDDEPIVKKMSENFFKELAQKANQLYNVMTDIIGFFTESKADTQIEDFVKIMTFLFNLVTNNSQITNLVEIICLRMNHDKYFFGLYSYSPKLLNLYPVKRLLFSLYNVHNGKQSQ